MARGRYPARTKLKVFDPAVEARYRIFWSGRALYHTPEQFPPLTAEALFDAAGPLVLELGCGTGEFLCTLAARQPDLCHLGVDISRKPLDRCVALASSMQLPNIRFVQADSSLLGRLIQPESLQAVYIHFPIPFLKTRSHLHHIYAPAMLEHIVRGLVADGRFNLLTDDESVLHDVQRAADALADLRRVPPESWHLAIEGDLKPGYQRLWELRGRTIWRAEWAKRSAKSE